MLDPRPEIHVVREARDPRLRNCKLGSKTRDTCRACDLIPYQQNSYQNPIKDTATKFQKDRSSDVKAQDLSSTGHERFA